VKRSQENFGTEGTTADQGLLLWHPPAASPTTNPKRAALIQHMVRPGEAIACPPSGKLLPDSHPHRRPKLQVKFPSDPREPRPLVLLLSDLESRRNARVKNANRRGLVHFLPPGADLLRSMLGHRGLIMERKALLHGEKAGNFNRRRWKNFRKTSPAREILPMAHLQTPAVRG
jgi:hypothetical protein